MSLDVRAQASCVVRTSFTQWLIIKCTLKKMENALRSAAQMVLYFIVQ
jgi:hypothetical protein